MPTSLDLLRHLRVTYGAAFAEQIAGAVEVGRTITPRKEQKRPGKGSSANWPFLSKAPCSSLYHPVCGTPLKLVSMLLQVTLYSMELVWGSRSKPSLVIDKDELRVLKMEKHVRSMIAIDINETQRHRDQIGIGSI